MIINKRAKWRHLRPDGKPVLDLDGKIVSVELTGSAPSSWQALLLRDDGTLAGAAVENLVVYDEPAQKKFSK